MSDVTDYAVTVYVRLERLPIIYCNDGHVIKCLYCKSLK